MRDSGLPQSERRCQRPSRQVPKDVIGTIFLRASRCRSLGVSARGLEVTSPHTWPPGERVVPGASRMARLPLSGDVIAPAISHCCGGPLPLLLGEVAFSSSSGATCFAPAATGSAIGGWRPPGMRPTQFRICSKPGCPEVVEGGGRCPEHLRLARSRNDARRRTSVERGYDHRWYRIAERYRKRHPVCEYEGCSLPSLHVHHRDGAGPLGDNSDANLQALCARHHNSLTARQPRPERRGPRPEAPASRTVVERQPPRYGSLPLG
jgi:5-methylcytosine-specific restriction enzyme A